MQAKQIGLRMHHKQHAVASLQQVNIATAAVDNSPELKCLLL